MLLQHETCLFACQYMVFRMIKDSLSHFNSRPFTHRNAALCN